jgi:hypothetical protein
VHLVVDEEVKRLVLSNRKVELLGRCISLLGKGEKCDLALRILKRYARENLSDAKEWRAWLAKNRDHLFFTNTGASKSWLLPQARPVPFLPLRPP